jgi:hypothetical protein
MSHGMQFQGDLAIHRGVQVDQMGRNVQESLVQLHPSHPQNDINPLTFQDDEVGRKNLPS